MRPDRLLLAGIGGVEIILAARRWADRRALYDAARRRARATGRRLVVLDPSPRGASRVAEDVALADGSGGRGLMSAPLPDTAAVPAGSAVVVVPAFERAEDIEAAWAEALRMAGTPDNVFVTTVPTWSFTSTLAPGHRWAVEAAPPGAATLVAYPITRGQKVAAAALVALLLWAAWREGADDDDED